MIDEAKRAEMRRLVIGEDWRIGTVARRFGVHHGVVRRAIRDTPSEVARAITPSALEPYKAYIVARLEKYPELTAARIFAELAEQGYQRGIAIVRRYVARIRGPREKKAYLRVQTTPGEQAQVDWGSFGWMRIGSTQRPVSCFAMVLSWSRALFLDFSLDQRIETFCAMHRRAFEFFGGVPKKILYDNLKTVVLHHVGTTIQFNPTFLSFAGQYLFEPTAAPPRYPQAKGRVEGAIRYIRHGFFYGRSFDNLADLRAKAVVFRDQTANTRLHAATRERPADVVEGIGRALVHRTFGAHYVRACIDQARFARGLGEPPEPVVTGHPAADRLEVEPHNLETYDDLFNHTCPAPQVPPTGTHSQREPPNTSEGTAPRGPGKPNHG